MTFGGRGVWLGFSVLLLLESTASAWAGTPQSATPLGNPGEWVTAPDYPLDALRNEVEGIAGFRLTIDADGLVKACEITSTSGSPELDATTCNLVTQRARFTPATDGGGRPTTGSYSNRVRWTLPNVQTETRPLGVIVQEFTFIVELDGKITDCKVLQQQTFGNLPAPDFCRDPQMQSRKPIMDASGHPVRKRVTIKNTMTAETTLTSTVSDP